jgi:hypothetical protein
MGGRWLTLCSSSFNPGKDMVAIAVVWWTLRNIQICSLFTFSNVGCTVLKCFPHKDAESAGLDKLGVDSTDVSNIPRLVMQSQCVVSFLSCEHVLTEWSRQSAHLYYPIHHRVSKETAEVQHKESGHARDVHACNIQVWHSWWTGISTELCVCQTYKFYRSWWVFALYSFVIMKSVDVKTLTHKCIGVGSVCT